MSLPYNKKLIPRAKELRKEMTKQEQKLWHQFLSKYSVRFQRQKVIDSYIADFYCHKAKLIIELDGSQHFTDDALAYDNIRTQVLEAYGLNVIRFTNAEVNNNFNYVCEVIEDIIYQLNKKR